MGDEAVTIDILKLDRSAYIFISRWVILFFFGAAFGLYKRSATIGEHYRLYFVVCCLTVR